MARAAKIYDFSLIAGGAFQLNVEGAYYRILSSTGPIEVRRDGGSALGPISAGQGEEDEFKRLTIVDKSGAANTGFIVVSDGTFVDQRITGEVAVIDGGKSRTYSGAAFLIAGTQGPVAAQNASVQLYNANATKNVIIEAFSASSSSAGALQIGRYNVPIAGGVNVPALANKYSNGGPAGAQIRNATQVGTLITTVSYLPIIAANSTFVCNLKEPIILAPNTGFIVSHSTLNTDLTANFEFYEDLVL